MYLVSARCGSGKMEKIQTTLESTLQSVDKAEAIAVQEAEKVGFDEEDAHQIGMAVRECMVNAVVHGIAVTIGDEGAGFDLSSLPDPTSPENLLRQSGRGILLIRAFMDEFDLHPRAGGGTEVRLRKILAKA
jgi:serine/threonine-protein kinase RsbW